MKFLPALTLFLPFAAATFYHPAPAPAPVPLPAPGACGFVKNCEWNEIWDGEKCVFTPYTGCKSSFKCPPGSFVTAFRCTNTILDCWCRHPNDGMDTCTNTCASSSTYVPPPAPTAKPPAPTAKPPAPTAKPPAPTAKPPAPTAKPPAPTAKPPAPTLAPPSPAPVKFVDIDFEKNLDTGVVFKAGDFLTSLGKGITVFAQKVRLTDGRAVGKNRAMVFDTDHPTGGDYDLGVHLGNALIITEDFDNTDPDDRQKGGIITLTFGDKKPSRIEKVQIVDVDYTDSNLGESFIFGTRADGKAIPKTIIHPGADKNVQWIYPVGATDVAELKIRLAGTGAITLVRAVFEEEQDCSSYQCPPNSCVRPGTQCLDSFDDCDCDYGFVKKGDECVCAGGKTLINGVCKDCSSYQCPTNSYVRPGTQCLASFGDCDCDYGFVKKGDECVCAGGKTLINGVCKDCSSYQCPTNSYVRPGTQCLASFGDCDCDYGFVKKGSECVCPVGKTLINGVCTACQVPHTPPASCSLFGQLIVFHHTYYPVGTILEVKYAGGYKSLPVTSSHQHYVREPEYLSYQSKPFQIRMTNQCGSSAWQTCKNFTPIGLDIAKTGKVGHITGSFEIDITGDGEINVLNEWFAPDVGILISTKHDVVDGNISGLHLFGDQGKTYSDGFAKLDMYHDKDEDDIIFGEELDGLAIWTDANSNAKLDDGELSQLSDHGIVALMSSHEDFKAEALLNDGTTILMEDLFFAR